MALEMVITNYFVNEVSVSYISIKAYILGMCVLVDLLQYGTSNECSQIAYPLTKKKNIIYLGSHYLSGAINLLKYGMCFFFQNKTVNEANTV